MHVINEIITRNSRGNGDLINITEDVAALVKASKFKQGNATVFVVGSTASIITFEYEPGLIENIKDLSRLHRRPRECT